MDKMEIISLQKRCKKRARKVPRPKKAPKLSKSDEPKKVSGIIDDPSEEEQKPKKVSRSSDGKKTATKAGKKVKKTSQSKKAPKSLEVIESEEEEEEGPPNEEEEVQIFLDLLKENKNLRIQKKVEKAVFMAGPYEGYELSYVALCDTKYLKRVLKMSGLEKKTKDLIKQALAKT